MDLRHLVNPASEHMLSAADCGDARQLQAFVQSRISVNAWPIYSPQLRQHLLHHGLHLGATSVMNLPALERMLHALSRTALRLEARLHLRNAFHRAQHNHDVLLRLLVLAWPQPGPVPEFFAAAATRIYPSPQAITEVLVQLLRALAHAGVPVDALARDVLAAMGHDYGHAGGTDRLDAHGQPTPLTHEDMAEKHIAKIGLKFGMTPVHVLQAMAGIRATTFHVRPGRERVTADNAFERRLKVADIMGCALPMPLWLVHVGLPVLAEKLPHWRTLLLQQEVDSSLVIQNLEDWLHSERGFLQCVDAGLLGTVALAQTLWRPALLDKVARLDLALARTDLLAPLAAQGFVVLEQLVSFLQPEDATQTLPDTSALQPALRELLALLSAPAPGSSP